MPEKIVISGSEYYRCPECGYIYASEETASRCEAWCSENKSCNLDIINKAAFLPDKAPIDK